MPGERKSIILDTEILKRIDAAAARDRRSRSNWIEVACLEKLERERRANAERDRV